MFSYRLIDQTLYTFPAPIARSHARPDSKQPSSVESVASQSLDGVPSRMLLRLPLRKDLGSRHGLNVR